MTSTKAPILCPNELFAALPVEKLNLFEPRTGCQARAQIIVDWLIAAGYTAGRAWVLAENASTKFSIPLKSSKGNNIIPSANSLNNFDEPASAEEAWTQHVDATVLTKDGYIVLAPALFDGPIQTDQFIKTFSDEKVRISFLRHCEAPLYGVYGSCYSAELQEEHFPHDHQLYARAMMTQVAALLLKPNYVKPDFVRIKAEPIPYGTLLINKHAPALNQG